MATNKRYCTYGEIQHHNTAVLQGFSAGAIRFLSNYTPLTWLLVSMLLAWAFKAVGTVVKWAIIILLGFVAYYLVKGYGIACLARIVIEKSVEYNNGKCVGY